MIRSSEKELPDQMTYGRVAETNSEQQKSTSSGTLHWRIHAC